MDATIDGDEEVISTLIDDGVDMNSVIRKVCWQSSYCVSKPKLMNNKLLCPSLCQCTVISSM